jgi:phage N-6-adenine-methyltransferase
MNRILFSSAKMDWETPQEFFDKYDRKYGFTLDVCALKKTAKCEKYFNPKINGLRQDWSKDICWMNPPYGRSISLWIKKAYDESKRGATVVCLIPARTDTIWWWDYCTKGKIEFIKGRLKFKGKNKHGKIVKNSATFPSAIVVFNPRKKR